MAVRGERLWDRERAMKSDYLVARTLRLPLGQTGRTALTGGDWDLAAVVGASIYYYLSDRRAGRPGWAVPPLPPPAAQPVPAEVTISLPESTWAELSEEAQAQGVEIERLVHHAALYFAADVDAGRVARRVIDGLAGR